MNARCEKHGYHDCPISGCPECRKESWNTRATDPLQEEMKAELKRLHIKQDEDRFAALADDSVPRLVFHAAIEAIANKDSLLEKMAEALEKSKEYLDEYRPHGHVLDQIEDALQEYRERSE